MITFVGCATPANILRYDDSTYPPKPDDFTINILDRDSIDRGVIAQVNDRQTSIKSDSQVMENLRQAARGLGGDALIDLETDTEDVSHDWIPTYQTEYKALVIVYTKDGNS